MHLANIVNLHPDVESNHIRFDEIINFLYLKLSLR